MTMAALQTHWLDAPDEVTLPYLTTNSPLLNIDHHFFNIRPNPDPNPDPDPNPNQVRVFYDLALTYL